MTFLTLTWPWRKSWSFQRSDLDPGQYFLDPGQVFQGQGQVKVIFFKSAAAKKWPGSIKSWPKVNKMLTLGQFSQGQGQDKVNFLKSVGCKIMTWVSFFLTQVTRSIFEGHFLGKVRSRSFSSPPVVSKTKCFLVVLMEMYIFRLTAAMFFQSPRIENRE